MEQDIAVSGINDETKFKEIGIDTCGYPDVQLCITNLRGEPRYFTVPTGGMRYVVPIFRLDDDGEVVEVKLKRV